jgi:acetyl-CoA acetyltransferase
MSDVVILGTGIHPFGRFETSYQEMGAQAATAALRDAGVEWPDIQAAYLARMYLPATSGARILSRLGSSDISILDIEAACASGGVALRQAVLAIRSGEVDLVLVLGCEKMPRGFMDPRMLYNDWQIELGTSVNPSYWAMRAMRHMHDHGTTEEQIAKVAFKNHRNSVHNPNAMYRKPFSMAEIMVLASAERARRIGTSGKVIHIAGVSHTVARYSADFRCPADSMSATAHNPGPTSVTATKVYAQAGLGPTDIDCFEVQDTDAFCEIEACEDLGLCAAGEGGALIDKGLTEIGGAMPVNMSGGLISKGEPMGASHLGQIVEIVAQLRGTCGPRQVSNAKVGLAHVLGAGGNCAISILKS